MTNGPKTDGTPQDPQDASDTGTPAKRAEQLGKPTNAESENNTNGTSEEGPYADVFAKLKWLFWNPEGALLLLAIILILAFATGFLGKVGDKGGEFFDWACAGVGACEDSTPPAPNWKVAFSTAVPHCLTGRLQDKLRDWVPPVTWKHDADRILICGDATIEGPKDEVPVLIADRFPSCFDVAVTEEALIVTASLDSGALCRVPFRFDGVQPVPTQLERGVILCVPNQTFKTSGDSAEIPECGPDMLKSFGFE